MEPTRPERHVLRAMPAAEHPPAAAEAGAGLGREIAQALQPALTAFERQLVQAVYRELEQAVVPDRQERPSGEPAAPRPEAEGQEATAESRVEPEGGATDMATEVTQRDPQETRAPSEQERQATQRREEPGTPRSSQTEQREGTHMVPRRRAEPERAGDERRPPAGAERRRARVGYVFDPRAAIRVALLDMAHSWKDAGSTYSAIYAFEEILRRYPDGGAAAAATEGVVEIVQTLQQQGKYYTALHVLETLDELL